ncbi:MAG: hypothetical protein FJZ56_03050 [Chlamydiae bacterium]|nr:hypothetical protein [Chlamydiota bacterium]
MHIQILLEPCREMMQTELNESSNLSRNGRFLMDKGMNFETPSEFNAVFYSPFHSEQDKIYQVKVAKFFFELLQFSTTTIHPYQGLAKFCINYMKPINILVNESDTNTSSSLLALLFRISEYTRHQLDPSWIDPNIIQSNPSFIQFFSTRSSGIEFYKQVKEVVNMILGQSKDITNKRRFDAHTRILITKGEEFAQNLIINIPKQQDEMFFRHVEIFKHPIDSLEITYEAEDTYLSEQTENKDKRTRSNTDSYSHRR